MVRIDNPLVDLSGVSDYKQFTLLTGMRTQSEMLMFAAHILHKVHCLSTHSLH